MARTKEKKKVIINVLLEQKAPSKIAVGCNKTGILPYKDLKEAGKIEVPFLDHNVIILLNYAGGPARKIEIEKGQIINDEVFQKKKTA